MVSYSAVKILLAFISMHVFLELTLALHIDMQQTRRDVNSKTALSSLPSQAIVGVEDNLQRKVFCNREVNGQKIDAVGFDMDFTLAQYNSEFDKLAYNGAKLRLVQIYGYPKEVMDLPYLPNFYQRGLLIDKKRGNILKLDRHKYARKVFHGIRELTTVQRKETYHSSFAQTSQFDNPKSFAEVDELYSVIDAMLFSQLVALKDATRSIPASYENIYEDIRACVDQCQKDGTIRDTVMQDPGKYIIYDAELVPMLRRFRLEGKKLFLLTNSFWEYTNVVMSYLVYSGGDNEDVAAWYDLFDLVVVGANKPAFLTDEYLGLFRVESNGEVFNIENKDELPKLIESRKSVNLFQGGHWKDLHKILGIGTGERVLYVGDHMYSDILRSKRSAGWRTCLVIPELELEIATAKEHYDASQKVKEFLQLQDDLDEYLDLLRLRVQMGAKSAADELVSAETKAAEIKVKQRRLDELYNNFFNDKWGQLFKAGNQESRFARNVFDFACLYTSKASNIGKVSSNKQFRPVQDFLPHDQILLDDFDEIDSDDIDFEEDDDL